MPAFIVLILKADRFAAEMLRQHVLAVHPGADCTLAHRVSHARTILAASTVDLFLADVAFEDGDVFELLPRDKQESRRARQTMVITGHCGARMLASLHSVHLDGVFDSDGDAPENIVHALRTIAEGRSYWSPTAIDDPSDERGRALMRQLTPTEQLSLALIGDGCGDKTAAERLGLQHSAARAVRRDLYMKLGAHDREDLIRSAAQLGYTRSTANGLAALGLCILVEEYRARSKRPKSLPAALLARVRSIAECPTGNSAPATAPGRRAARFTLI